MRRSIVALLIAAATAALLPDSGIRAQEALRVGPAEAYRTIASALAAARVGQAIEVTSGTYAEVLDIGKSVGLRGVDTGGGMPVIDGRGNTAPVRIKADSVAIENLAITSTNSPVRPLSYLTPYLEEACILVTGNNATIRGNRLTGCAQGIYVRNSDGFLIEGNEVTGNHRGGMLLLNSHEGRVSGNVVTDNGPYQGIAVHSFSFPRGIEYSLRAAGLVGDWWQVTPESRDVADILSENIEIVGNRVSGHGGAGIALSFTRHILVADNESHHNGGAEPNEAEARYFQMKLPFRERGAGIMLYCDAYENAVRQNRVFENDNIGILLGGSYWNRIEDNGVEDNPYGILVMASFGNRLIGNAVTGSAQFGIRVERGQYDITSVDTLVARNHLDNPGINGFDDTGADNPVPWSGWLDIFPIRKLPPFPMDALKRANAWDDGIMGNHHSDFDEEAEGFRDADGNGIGEVAHPIPGGASVDRFPLRAPDEGMRKSGTEGRSGPAEAACEPGAGCPAAGPDLVLPCAG